MDPPLSKKAGIDLLKKRIGEIADLERDAGSRGIVFDGRKDDEFYLACQLLKFDIWRAIKRAFGADSEEARFYLNGVPEFERLYESYLKSGYGTDYDGDEVYGPPTIPLGDFLRGKLVIAKAQLNHAIKRLDESIDSAAPETLPPAPTPDRGIPGNPPRRAFIVHGHDEAVREAVARFMERIDFDVIILHERANQGQTVIEKFEANADVGFAIILLTPDDIGGKDTNNLRARARQNVILELGYFIGLLGRKRVMALRKGDLEFPSDILGVVAEVIDEHGAWKQRLAKELVNAGYDIDWNKAMR